jgi:asparagine synthase (glutamine-hydrolysing)
MSMRDTLVHRGPDDAGVYVDGTVGLGHRRLSIVDLTEAGHQPMSNEDGTVWLIFNGEIYNYVELAAELKNRGHAFKSATDTEVILHLYEEVGERCVERLNGMFAFLIWDERTRTLFGARDRIGIKPLYYYLDDRRFICASEIKAILEHPDVPRRPDLQGLADYLFVGSMLGGKTPLVGIQELLPAHQLRFHNDHLHIRRYWDVQYDYRLGRPWEAAVEEVAVLLQDAVRVQCRSDAPLGCHLSGGIDSSTVTCLAAQFRDPLPSFSVRFADHHFYNETAFARLVSRHARTVHHEVAPGAQDLLELLGALVWHMDTPMPGTGGFSYHAVSRAAAAHVKVTLTGHGGDEVFAGYPAQFQVAFGNTAMFDLSGRPSFSDPVWRRLRRRLRATGAAGLLRATGRIRRRTAPQSLESQWMALHCSRPPRENVWLDPRFVEALDGYTPEVEYLRPLSAARTNSILDRCLYHDLTMYLPGLLHQEDRVSMALSLESRVPLLDHRLVEFMATVSPEQKVRNLVPKGLLRAAAARWVPGKILQRTDKIPFAVPMRDWFGGPLREPIWDILDSPQARGRGIFDPKALRARDIEPGALWHVLNTEVWFRLFIDRDATWLALRGAARRPLSTG